mgnify:CR=1 FL=1
MSVSPGRGKNTEEEGPRRRSDYPRATAVAPDPRLRPYICAYRFFELDAARAYTVPAWTRHMMLFRYGEFFYAYFPDGTAVPHLGASFFGPTTRPLAYGGATGRYRFVAAEFRPLVMASILRERVDGLTDRVVEADAVLRRGETVWVTDALSAAPDDAQRVRVLDSLFLQLFSRRSIEIPPKLAAALSVVWSGGCFGYMPELIARTGYSERTLRRRFRTATGLSPRQYHVVLRAERALSALYYRPELGLDDVAHYAGYSDQSHLIHHMRRLTGMTPGALRGEPCAGVAPLRDFFRPASGRTIQYNSA